MSAYVDNMFRAQQAASFGIVRRSEREVERLGVLDEIIDRAESNGWHVLQTGGQIVVLCHPGALTVHC
jgi:hypothetical protein